MASSSLPFSEPTSNSFTCQTDSEMESSKARHWSELNTESSTDSEWSAETNYTYFNELKKDPEWGRFFIDSDTFEVGKKISHGAQADIYEARMKTSGVYDLVVKVMKGDNSLQAFQAQWPIGMLSARSRYKHLYDLPLITILGGTLLEDERLKGRFAFVMYRRWGDLRLLIDRRMNLGKRLTTSGPFSIDQVIHLMLRIAEQMDILHTKHDILHRDLKASNVLVWGKFEDGVIDTEEKVELVVADFECSRLVIGTSFWKAPEIFQQLKDGVPSSKVEFTSKSDVYSYGMTSYEILSGATPFHPEFDFCERDEVLSGRRPDLPSDVPLFLRDIIVSCWHSNPKERPSFSDICLRLLKERLSHNPATVVIDNNHPEIATYIKDLALEQANEVTNIGETSYTSEVSEYYTSIAELTPKSAPAPARIHPTLLKEYQSKDIREVKRTGLADIKYVKKGKGTVLGKGGQATIHEVVVNTGVEHVGLNARYETYALKKFNGLSMDSLPGQWQEEIHRLSTYYGSFICEVYGYCRDYEADGSGSDEEEEEVPGDGVLNKAATWMKKLWSGEKYESTEEKSFKMGSFCLLMRKYDCSLRDVLNEVKLKPGVAISMMVQIAVGMKIVHQEGIVHGDVKADNIFVYKSDKDNMPWGAYIGDFDVAESVTGTIFWRAPELLEPLAELHQLRMEKDTLEEMKAVKVYIPWSPMADVYSYGMTCYEILTGRTPFKGRNRKEEIDCVVKQGLRPELPANLNPAIRDLIHSCWHQDPLQRPTFGAILLEFKRILHELPRFLAMVDEVGNLPPVRNKPSTEECIARLERIEAELRAKYPEEFFVGRDELDFVELQIRWTRTMKKFVTRFGYKPYIDHPSLPWSLWFKRMKGLMKVQRLLVEAECAIPFMKARRATCILRIYISEAIFEGFESDYSYPDEEGGVVENQKLILLQRWIERVRDLPPLVNRHHGCIQMLNHGHFEGIKDYLVCDWCKEEIEKDVMIDVKFQVFDDKFASEYIG